MLVLSRKKSEVIRIDGGIVITIVETRAHKVRIGIDAPRGVGIWREEIAQRIEAEINAHIGRAPSREAVAT